MAAAISAIFLAIFASLLCIMAVGVASPVALGSKDAAVTKNAVHGGELEAAGVSRIAENPLPEEGIAKESSQILLGTSKVME